MHGGSIRIPESQFECSREHSDTERATTARRVSRCFEEAFGYALRLSGYWTIVSECLQLEIANRKRTGNKKLK